MELAGSATEVSVLTDQDESRCESGGLGRSSPARVGSCERRRHIRHVFEVCSDALYRFILVRVGGSRDVADDLLQQTCFVAAGHRRIPQEDEACEAWMRGIARNLIKKHWRQLKRRNGQIGLSDAVLSAKLADAMESGPLPADQLVRDETVGQLLLAVTSLPAADQRLVFAYYFDGCSQAEIAESSGVTPKSIETQLYRIRGRLRAILRHEERTDV